MIDKIILGFLKGIQMLCLSLSLSRPYPPNGYDSEDNPKFIFPYSPFMLFYPNFM
jgi:hypothetical protein